MVFTPGRNEKMKPYNYKTLVGVSYKNCLVKGALMRINISVFVKKSYFSLAVFMLFFLILVGNGFAAAPVVTITSVTPSTGAISYEDPITFIGSVTDAEDDDATLTEALVWKTDDPSLTIIGTGGTFTAKLPVGSSHTITATVTDSDSETHTATYTLVDPIVITNFDPNAVISSITGAQGTPIYIGDDITFSATGSNDHEDSAGSLIYSWASSDPNAPSPIGTGSTLVKTLPAATHNITLTVTDSKGGTTNSTPSEVTVITNTIPTAIIDDPDLNDTFDYQEAILFNGSGNDIEDTPSGVTLKWTLNPGGVIGTSGTFQYTPTTTGVHTITLESMDTRLATSDPNQSTITFTVNNADPNAAITAPGNNTTYDYGDDIIFTGIGTDLEDTNLTLAWTSSLGGSLGNGSPYTTNTLQSGTHVITLRVTDSASDWDEDSITVIVRNASPTASITSINPNNQPYGTSVTFTGTGTDVESPTTLPGSALTWSSSLDGFLGTGTSLSLNTISSGTHTITLTATDSDNGTGTATAQLIVQNTAPTATITNPVAATPDPNFDFGQPISFQGTGTDAEDTLTGTSLVWTSSQGDPMGTGSPLTLTTLTSGDHTITLTVTDSKGMSHTDTVDIVVGNAPPTASIDKPESGSNFNFNQYITFEGTGSDPEDGQLSGSELVWTSSSDPNTPIGQGETLSINTLPSGTHTITLTVTDRAASPDTGTDTDTITVIINNATPTVTITTPAQNSTHSFSSSITFAGTATDPEDDAATPTPLALNLSWSSDRDGFLGTGTSITSSSLSVGTHIITFTAIDSASGQGTDTVTISVGDEPPTAVNITAPADGASYYLNDFINFQGNAADSEDGSLTGSSLAWTSNLESGSIGTGTNFTTNSLNPGEHLITLTATDSTGKFISTFILVTVVNRLPTALISIPSTNSEHIYKRSVTFAGTGVDPENGDLSNDRLTWTSDRDGVLGTGTPLSTSNLTVGTHVITLTVKDDNGGTDTASITILVDPDEQPTGVYITAPIDRSTHYLTEFVRFQGSATDEEDIAITGTGLVWTSSLTTAPLGTGNDISTNSLIEGEHLITLTATDSNGGTNTAFVLITVENRLPVVTLTSPADGSDHVLGDPVSLAGSAEDPEYGTLSGTSLGWSSNRDGDLGTGSPLLTSSLTLGTHVITLTATDKNGGVGTVSRTITISNDEIPTTVTITLPADGAEFFLNDLITFQGSSVDKEDGTLTGASLVWTSSRESGNLGTGQSFSLNTLSQGEHLITLTSTDSNGSSKKAFVAITVKNYPPVPEITLPTTGSVFNEGDVVQFQGSASDPEDVVLTGSSLAWESNINGVIGIGVKVLSSKLTAGEHTITLKAKDSNGSEAKTTVAISVNATAQGMPFTLGTDRILVPLNATGDVLISGGHPPYRVERDHPLIAGFELAGDTLTIQPTAEGETTFRIMDHFNFELVLEVVVTPDSANVPVADAGTDQNVFEGETVTLDGSNSLPGTFGIVSWWWSQTAGDTALVFGDDTAGKTTFVAPVTDVQKNYGIRLTVMDANGTLSSDDVTVSVFDNGVTGFPFGATTFSTADQSNVMGVNVVGDGEFVLLKGAFSGFIGDTVNRPENMLYDLIEFKVKMDFPGDTAQILLYLPAALEEGFSLYKYSPAKGWYTLPGSNFSFNADRTMVFITLVDGGTGDDDDTADGVICDPLTFGTAPSTTGTVTPPASGGGGGGGCFITALKQLIDLK